MIIDYSIQDLKRVRNFVIFLYRGNRYTDMYRIWAYNTKNKKVYVTTENTPNSMDFKKFRLDDSNPSFNDGDCVAAMITYDNTSEEQLKTIPQEFLNMLILYKLNK